MKVTCSQPPALRIQEATSICVILPCSLYYYKQANCLLNWHDALLNITWIFLELWNNKIVLSRSSVSAVSYYKILSALLLYEDLAISAKIVLQKLMPICVWRLPENHILLLLTSFQEPVKKKCKIGTQISDFEICWFKHAKSACCLLFQLQIDVLITAQVQMCFYNTEPRLSCSLNFKSDTLTFWNVDILFCQGFVAVLKTT